MQSSSHVLVIGGSGFVGSHLIEQLLQKYPKLTRPIINFDIRNNEQVFSHLGDAVQFVKGSINDSDQLLNLFEENEIDTIFHCATPPPFAPDKVLNMVNIEGTDALLQAVRMSGTVKRIVLVSSSSVVYDGGDIVRADESMPYAKNAYNTYTRTKIEQEKRILAFDGTEGIHTAAVRPAAIFGPRDGLMFPQVAEQAKQGRLKFAVGDGQNMYSFTYVKNVAHGIILAAQNLGKDDVHGEAFFLTNDEDIPFWDMLSGIARFLDCPTPSIHIPYQLYWFICLIVAAVVYLLNLLPCFNVTIPVSMSFDKLKYLTSTRTFDCNKAKERLGYRPLSMEKSLQETYDHFEYLKDPKGKPKTS